MTPFIWAFGAILWLVNAYMAGGTKLSIVFTGIAVLNAIFALVTL